MNIQKIISLLLAALLLTLSLTACRDKDQTDTPTSPEESTTIPFSETGIVSHGTVKEAELPSDTALADWYEQAKAREQLTDALFYAKDAEDGLWHCWLYVGSYREGDSLELGAGSADGTVYIRHTAASPDEIGAACVFYFTVDREGEPTFELHRNNDISGLLLTLAQAAVKQP